MILKPVSSAACSVTSNLFCSVCRLTNDAEKMQNETLTHSNSLLLLKSIKNVCEVLSGSVRLRSQHIRLCVRGRQSWAAVVQRGRGGSQVTHRKDPVGDVDMCNSLSCAGVRMLKRVTGNCSVTQTVATKLCVFIAVLEVSPL